MDTHRTPREQDERRWSHRWRAITRIAVAGTLLAVGTVVGVVHPDSARAAAASTDAKARAEEVAREFLDAYGAFDADRALTLLTERAVAAAWGTPAKFRLELSLLQASGWKQAIRDLTMPAPPPGSDGCDAYDFVAHKKTLPTGRLIVYCTYDYHGIRSDAIGRGPYGDAYWAIVVDNGRIVSAENRNTATPFHPFDDEMREPFRRWVWYAHPLDAMAMYEGVDRADWKRSVESARLWDEHTREYVAAGAPYIARANAICTAAHERLDALYGPPPGFGPPDSEPWPAYFAASARVLEEALAELRAVPPPVPFLEQFGRAYAVGDQLVAQLRGDPADALFAVADRHQFGGQPGLRECSFDLPG